MASNSRYSISVILTAINGISKPLLDISTGFGKLTDKLKAVKKESAGLAELGRTMTKAGRWMSFRVTAPLVAVATLSTKAAMDINKGMANIGTLIPVGINRLKQLRTAIQEISVDTGILTESTEAGLVQLIKYYGDSVDIANKLKVINETALAASAAPFAVATLVGEMSLAFDDFSNESLRKFASRAEYIREVGQGTFEQLAEAMGYVLPIAKDINISIDEVAAAFAVLSKYSPGNLSRVGYQLSNVFFRLSKYQSVVERINEVGLSETLGEVLEELGNRENIISFFGSGSRSLTGLYALAAKGGEVYKKAVLDMAKAEDRLLRAGKQQRDGINKTGFSWKQFKSRLQVVRQVLGEQMLPYLDKLLGYLEKALVWFINLSPATKNWLIKLGTAAAIIGPLLLGFGGLITFMVGLKVAASLLGVTVLGLFLPFMKFFLIWGLIGVAIYALKSIIENTFDTSLILPEWKTVKEWFVEFFHFMGVGFSTLKEGIRDAFKNQGALLWDWLPQSWRDSIENSFRNLIGLERKGPVFGADYRPDSYFSYENTRQGSGVWEIDRGSTNLGSIDIKLSAEKGTSGKISETSINNKNLSINFIDEIYAGGTR